MAISTFKTLYEILGGKKLTVDDFPINRLIIDSRKVKNGDVFIAIKGFTVNGKDFIPQAISAGASVVLIETNRISNDLRIDYLKHKDQKIIPQIKVFQLSQKLSKIAADFYHSPSKHLSVI